MAIFDCFTFFNELDILELRLTELYDVVDYFVLVEATHTHKGDPKPLYFANNRQRFAAWADKIVHVVVGDLPGINDPDEVKYHPASIWRREMTQRQCILRGLMQANDNDVVMVSDLDEIPRRTRIYPQLPTDIVLTYQQRLYYYNFNTVCTNLVWRGTRAATMANVRAITPDGLRWIGPRGDYPKLLDVQNAGWHLSYFGDVTHIQNKMKSFLHQELVNDETLDADNIALRIANGTDVWGRENDQKFEVGLNADLPYAVRTNPVRWAPYFHVDYQPTFTEDWFTTEQTRLLDFLIKEHTPADGEIIEIGCWEGRSTVALAQAAAPRVVHAVDHWKGNPDEGANHPATVAAQERDVHATFLHNIKSLTSGNVKVHQQDWREWAESWNKPIAFLHLDAAHDKTSVLDCLNAIKPFLVNGAILCGDDYYAIGVREGVAEALGAKVQDAGGRMWVYQHVN